MIASSKDNSVLNALRSSKASYGEALSVLVDSKREQPTKAQRIRPNSPRGKLLQRLLSLGPVRLVPDPHDGGWVYKGGSYSGQGSGRMGYIDRLEGYSQDAELILRRLVRAQRAQRTD